VADSLGISSAQRQAAVAKLHRELERTNHNLSRRLKENERMRAALEASNVDIAHEFALLISAQRGYQANARAITPAD
jgi:flagellar basal body rod protein FlgG